MSSIILEKTYQSPQKRRWHNADGDLPMINASITSKTAQLSEATALLKQATDAINILGPYSEIKTRLVDVKLTGRNISTWRDQRDRYAPLVDRYKKELSDLLVLQKEAAAAQSDLAASARATAEAAEAAAKAKKVIIEAEIEETKATASKLGTYALIAGIGIAIILGGIIIFKKLKKK